MMRCPDSRRIQDYIDGELSERSALELREHLAECASCAMDVALFRQAFECLDQLPLADPPRLLAERVLERVLPSRVRRRWIATVGWSYAGVWAATVAVACFTLSRPGARAGLEWLAGEASRRLIHSLVFVVNVLGFGVMSVAGGWGLVTTTGARMAPIFRALFSLLSQPSIQLALGLAAVSCVGVLWWMRPRSHDSVKGIRHVGLLGF